MITLAYISGFSILLPAILGLLKFKYAENGLRLIICYFLFCLVIEGITMYMTFIKMNNNAVADFFYIAEGLILITFFYMMYDESEFRIPAIILATVYVIYGCYTTFIDPGYMVYNSNYRAAESLMIQALTAYALLKISNQENLEVMKHAGFWISAGFFIYFSVNLVVFISATFLFADNIALMRKTWMIHSIVNIGANIIFTFGLLCIPPRQPRF